ncbi:hypothetical protein JYU34_018343 [Plutella xylostella]|uniref:Uncharacterized protein n=1 Tax=Plutella xylostella TaxID=51655 RepID=A0ABQ7PXL8_PLUXY|nr:hypothetical protein JYU34_018343 [Plutella xylostella]
MSKTVESVIRELQKTLESLVIKVSALELKIGEQSAIIASQSSLISRIGPPSPAVATPTRETTTPKVTPQPAPARNAQAALQRPVRQARLAATAAISGGKSAATTVGVKQVQPRASLGERSAAATAAAVAEVRTSNGRTSSAVATKGESVPLSKIENTHGDSKESEWTIVGKSKRPRNARSHNTVIEGVGKQNYGIKTVKKLKYIQAWMFAPTTTTDLIIDFLKKVIPSLTTHEEFHVEKRVINTDRHSSFIIGIREDKFDELKTPTLWPPGVKYSDWFLARPRHQRGHRESSPTRGSGSAPRAAAASD